MLALAAAACVAFIALGNWQSRRADAKRALAHELDAAARAAPLELAPGPLDPTALVHRRVVARGSFVAEGTVLLANRLRHGRSGYEVVTPLRLGDSQWHMLVNRGWVAAPASPGAIAAGTPGGLQAIDISDPGQPTQAGWFSPTPEASVSNEDPALSAGPNKVVMWSYPIIKDGLIYVVDIRNGLYILRYTGPNADEVDAIHFLEGNSNLGDAVALSKSGG